MEAAERDEIVALKILERRTRMTTASSTGEEYVPIYVDPESSSSSEPGWTCVRGDGSIAAADASAIFGKGVRISR
jgi:hypothetical protein